MVGFRVNPNPLTLTHGRRLNCRPGPRARRGRTSKTMLASLELVLRCSADCWADLTASVTTSSWTMQKNHACVHGSCACAQRLGQAWVSPGAVCRADPDIASRSDSDTRRLRCGCKGVSRSERSYPRHSAQLKLGGAVLGEVVRGGAGVRSVSSCRAMLGTAPPAAGPPPSAAR